jgi:hypothetical protein
MKKLIPILLVALLLVVGLALPASGSANANDDIGPYTPGLWKTHSQYGPAPYHSTWDGKDGGDAPFFGTGYTYYEVLHMPSKGRVYFVLAHQYIATELNMMNGSPVTQEVVDTSLEAQALLVQYQGDFLIPKSEKMLVIQLSEILDDYNNGLLTP